MIPDAITYAIWFGLIGGFLIGRYMFPKK